MVKFLSPEWAETVTAALNNSGDVKDVLGDVELTLQQIVTGGPDGEVTYWTRFANGVVEGGVGEVSEPDVTITQDYETAAALSRNDLNAQSAFMQGKLKVKGNMGKLLQNQTAIQELGPVMASVQTEY